MKKSIFKKLGGLFLGLAMGLGVAVGAAAGNKASEVKAVASPYILTPNANQSGNKATAYVTSAYSFTYDDIGWTFNQWNPSTLQIKTNQSSAGSEFYFNNTTAFPGKITKVTITFKALSVSNASGLCFLGGTSEQTGTTGGTAGSWDSSAKTLTWAPASTTNYTYFKFYQNGKCATGTNNLAAENAIKVEYQSGFNVTYSSYKPNDAIGDVQGMPSSVTGVSTHTVSTSLPTVGGYTCDGWSTASGGAKVYNGGETLSAAATLYPHWVKDEYSISNNITNGTLSLTCDNPISFKDDLYAEIIPNSGYRFPTLNDITIIMGENTDITEDAYDPDDGSILYEGVTGNITITATCPIAAQDYAVDYSGSTNVEINGPDVIYANTSEQYTITAASGYKLPENVTVSGATGLYSKSAYNTATLTISEASEDVSFSVAGIALADYGVAFAGENYTHTAVTTIQEFGSATITLTPATHYDLPASVSVTNAEYSYTKSNSQLVISNPTGAVTITVDPVARERYGITVTGTGDSADFFTYSGATEIYATESATVTIAPDAKGTDDIYVIRASDISVSGATKGTYNTTTHVLNISNPTGAVTITVTPVKKVLQSISVTTQPTKTSYDSGDTLNTAGLVVTATYTSGTETVPLSELKFSQTKLAVVGTAGTAKSETIYVYYGGKSTSFTVNVTPVKTGTSGWNLVSATSELANNDKIIIAAKDYNYAISTTQNSNNRGQASITKSSDGKTATLGTGVQEITLVKNDDNTYSFKCGTSGYLYAASSSSNYMKTQSSIDGNAKWTISISSNTATITAQGSNTRNVMQYNQSSSIFSAYATASQKALCIYKYIEADPKTGVAIDASYPAGDYTAEETINVSNISATLVYNDGTSTSVTSGLSINPSTFVEGTHEYTVSYSTYSTVIQIANVKPAKQMIGIELNTDNVTKAFVVDSTFEHDGLVVYGVYDNGDKEEITAGYHVSSPDMSTAGTKTITVTYQDFEEQTYDIEVSDSAIMNIVQGAVIEGYEGETRALEVELLNFSSTASWSLNPTSSEYYSLSNVSQSSSGYSATVTLIKACEEIELEISEANSGAESVTVAITVYADELTGITASTSKSTYVDGQTFDVSTVSVTAHYSSPAHEDESIDIGDCAITAKDSRDQAFNLENPFEIDTYTITVSYGGKSDSFTVTSSMPQTYLCVMTEIPGDSEWVKVSAADGITDGVYQFVYETDGKARFFNNADATSDYVEKNIPSSGKIADSSDIYTVTISSMTGGYSLKCTDGSFDGQYICGQSGSNTIKTSATAVAVSISFNTDGTVTALYDSTSFRFNSASGSSNDRFRFYKTSTTGDSYHFPYLYKKVSGESDKSYNLVAVNENVYRFLKEANKFKCDNSGESFDSESWTALATTFASLLPAEKKQLQDAVVSYGSMTSDALYTNFIEKYEYIVWKYGESYDFMKKGISSGAKVSPIISLSDVEPTTWIIAVVAGAGLTAIGGYFFYKKRKEI